MKFKRVAFEAFGTSTAVYGRLNRYASAVYRLWSFVLLTLVTDWKEFRADYV